MPNFSLSHKRAEVPGCMADPDISVGQSDAFRIRVARAAIPPESPTNLGCG
jgi:hypothetical protein